MVPSEWGKPVMYVMRHHRNMKPTMAELASLQGRWRHHPRYAGCIGHWLFNDGAGLTLRDISGYDRHGTLTNGPTWVLKDDGYQLNFASVSNHQVILPSFNLSSTNYSLVAKGALADSTTTRSILWAFGVGTTTERIRFQTTTTPQMQYLDDFSVAITNTTTLTLNQTYTFCVTYDFPNQVVQLIVDDTSVNTDTAFTEYTTTDNLGSILIGARTGNTTLWDGTISEIRIYDQTLINTFYRSFHEDPYAEFRWAHEQSRIFYSVPVSPGGAIASSYYYRSMA